MAGIFSLGDVRDKGSTWENVSAPIHFAVVVRNTLLNALAYADGDQKKAAELLGLSTRIIGYMMRSHGIPPANIGKLRKGGGSVGHAHHPPKKASRIPVTEANLAKNR